MIPMKDKRVISETRVKVVKSITDIQFSLYRIRQSVERIKEEQKGDDVGNEKR